MAVAETSQTLDRGLRVLELLAPIDTGLTVTELAAELDVSRTVVYRLVVTLEQHALLRRDQAGRCRLGWSLLALSRQLQPVLRDAALPALRRLAEVAAGTAYLAIVDGGEVLIVAVVEPPHAEAAVQLRAGLRQPLERSAAGRALIAGRAVAPGDTTEGGGVEPLVAGPISITNADPVVGRSHLAAPVAGVPGIEAAIGVSVATETADEQLAARVQRAAAEVARSLR